MNANGASLALKAIAGGDHAKLQELSGWLLKQEGISGKFLPPDIRQAALDAAEATGDGGLERLLTDLRNRSDSVLAFFFPGASAPGVAELPNALVGPAAALRDRAPAAAALGEWPEAPDTLGILTWHPAQGRLGAVRTAAWLQTVLGAIGLAMYARSQVLAPLVPCPTLGRAVFIGAAGEPRPADWAAALVPGPPDAAELNELLADPESRELLGDAAALTPGDLAQHRLTLASRWLQVAASAVSNADAFVALGIALETITGDGTKTAVVERITKRAAIFKASLAPAAERADLYYEELARAKKLYDRRSRAAHGQHDEWAADQADDDEGRAAFHRFVLDVALGFRQLARARGMRDVKDFQAWWKRAEVEGFFS